MDDQHDDGGPTGDLRAILMQIVTETEHMIEAAAMQLPALVEGLTDARNEALRLLERRHMH